MSDSHSPNDVNLHDSLAEKERTMLMLDTSPLCTQIWDKNLNTIDCNEAGVRLYGFKSKQEYAERFVAECSPEFQPDGQRSDEKAVMLVHKTFEEGFCTFEWMHRIPDCDTVFPAEVTLVRAKYSGDDVVLGYTRDLREHYRMMEDIRHRDNLLQAVNKAAVLLLTTEENEDIEVSIHESMELVGRSIDADRVHIWRDEKSGDESRFILKYQWLSKVGKRKVPVPLGAMTTYSGMAGWISKFMRNEYIGGPLSKLLPEEQVYFTDFDIKSVFLIPLFLDEKLWGLVSIDDCLEERDFTGDEIAILRSVSLMMASAINRHALVIKRTQDLAQKTTELNEVLESIEIHHNYTIKLNDALVFITKSPNISSGDIKAAADVIIKEGCVALNTHRVSIWNLTEDAVALNNISCYDMTTGKHIVQDDFDLLNRKEYSKSLKTERLIVTNDVSNSMYNIFHDGYAPEMCAMLDAPIRVDGKLVGVVCVEQDRCDEYPDKREWMIEEQNFVSSLADLMALSIASYEWRVAREAAELANQTKSAFLANVSHEIRTPMNSIVGFSELALDDDIPERTRDYLANILDNSGLLLQIINDILDISKIEAGKMELESFPFDLHEMLSACRSTILPKAIEKGLELYFYAEPNIKKKPLGDPTRLRQVLTNLLSNAVKFTPSGKIKLMIDVKEKSDDTVTLRFEIKDSGIGMTSEQVKKVFEPFIQAETGTTRIYGGSGLGLPITNNLVEMMGGTISVESAPGVGSTFSFELTFETTDEDFIDLVDRDLLRGELQKPTFEGDVLVCEDNAMNQLVISDHLERVGLNTVIAENGEIGVELVESRMHSGEKQFDLIFMDMHMPVMDGFEATARILELGVNVPIVAMTANIMSSDRDIYIACGMQGYVGKPFTSQELWRCLMRFFAPIAWQTEKEAQRARTKKGLRQRLINNFVKNNTNLYAEISDALASGDVVLAHRLVHTLKSNAAQLEFEALSMASEDVEKQLSDGLMLVTPQQLDTLKTELDAALEELLPQVDEIAPATGNLLETEATWTLFMKLGPLLEEGDSECLSLVEDLRRIPGSATLIQHIEDLDFEPAAATLAELQSVYNRRTE